MAVLSIRYQPDCQVSSNVAFRRVAAPVVPKSCVVAKMPGVKCPTCAANGQEVWVIPGRTCGYCGTGCYTNIFVRISKLDVLQCWICSIELQILGTRSRLEGENA